MVDMRFLIHGEARRQAAVQQLKAAGFAATAPKRRMVDDGHPLEVADVDEDRQPEVERIVQQVAPRPSSGRVM